MLRSSGERERPGRACRSRPLGQGVVEFTLVFPLFLIALVSIIEFAFAFHAALGLNFATRNASLVGAEAGNRVGADCEIVATIQKSISAPMDQTLIRSVTIFQADQTGANASGLKDVWTYAAGAQTSCPTESNPNQKVDFTATIGWPASSVNPGPPATTVVGKRCDVLAGCLQATASRTPLSTRSACRSSTTTTTTRRWATSWHCPDGAPGSTSPGRT